MGTLTIPRSSESSSTTTSTTITMDVMMSRVISGVPAAQDVTYECTFTNLWSQQTHPIMYPQDAHWSPPVLAAHSRNYVMWKPDLLASEGVEDVAEVSPSKRQGYFAFGICTVSCCDRILICDDRCCAITASSLEVPGILKMNSRCLMETLSLDLSSSIMTINLKPWIVSL